MSRPKLVVLSLTEKTASRICMQLEEVFSLYLTIEGHWFDGIAKGQKLSGDLILITSQHIVSKAMEYVGEGEKTLTAKRLIPFDCISELFDIPTESNVVVANVERNETLEALAQMQELGVNHLNLLPYYPPVEWPDLPCKYAVVFGEKHLVAERKDIKTIDLGVRVADLTTCILIAQFFHILDSVRDEVQAAFIRPNVKMTYVYFSLLKKNSILNKNLQTILNNYEKSTVLISMDGSILFHNQKARNLLEIDNDVSPYSDLLLSNYTDAKSGFFLELDGDNYYVNVCGVESNSDLIMVFEDLESIEIINNKYRNLQANGLVAEYTFKDIVCKSHVMRNLIRKAQQFARSDSTIHISGESGCGKELIAQAIHNASKRKNEAFVAVNFAALSSNLSEAELFGYVEGSFTGAKKGGEKGLFELADKGTIFLDEIGDCSPDIQKKILRVIQEKKVMPVGSNRWIPIDIRIISATNQDLNELLAKKEFRKDLYYRLNVLPLAVPPLRSRWEDILPLFYSFLNNSFNLHIDSIGRDLESCLLKHHWQGNVRELRNVAEYVANCMTASIDNWQEEVKSVLSSEPLSNPAPDRSEYLEQLNSKYEIHKILAVLEALNQKPYVWTRAALSKALPEISESVIKNIIIVLSDNGLAISRKGYGTRITVRGRELLNTVKM